MTADPLLTAAAERLAYATGQLLGAEDFAREQTYHRGRLALALRHLVGHGTVAGLRVRHSPAADGRPEELRVEPGVAIDRHGRLLELARPRCLDLARWYDAPEASHIGALERGVDAASGGVVADVFALFEPCPRAPGPALGRRTVRRHRRRRPRADPRQCPARAPHPRRAPGGDRKSVV